MTDAGTSSSCLRSTPVAPSSVELAQETINEDTKIRKRVVFIGRFSSEKGKKKRAAVIFPCAPHLLDIFLKTFAEKQSLYSESVPSFFQFAT